MEPCIPLPLADGNTLKELIQKAKDWAIMHGKAKIAMYFGRMFIKIVLMTLGTFLL